MYRACIHTHAYANGVHQSDHVKWLVLDLLLCCFVASTRGVARGKCMWKHGRRSGLDRFVTQLCPARGFGGTVSLPAGFGAKPRKQTHFWQQSIENWLEIRSVPSHVGKHETTYFKK